MVDMDKKEQILHYHRIDGLSQREIARRVGVCRKTVKRYITEYEAQVQSDPEDSTHRNEDPQGPSFAMCIIIFHLFLYSSRPLLDISRSTSGLSLKSCFF